MTPPENIGRYRIGVKLGEGMGAVYRATDTKLGRDVAVKILPDAVARDPERLARFGREAKTLAALNHPHVAQIYGVEDRALVMELVEGATLRGPLPIETALTYAKQIAETLEAAHDKGIIHRDLKPANIMVTRADVQLIKRCLTRDRKLRLQAIGEARILLGSLGVNAAAEPGVPSADATVRQPATSRLPWILAAAALTAAAVLAFLQWRQAPLSAADSSTGGARFFLSPEAIGSIAAPCVSPYGRTIAYFGEPEAKDRRPALYVRPLDSLTARPILEVDDGSSLFWSADSRSLAFVAGGQVEAVGGGPPRERRTNRHG